MYWSTGTRLYYFSRVIRENKQNHRDAQGSLTNAVPWDAAVRRKSSCQSTKWYNYRSCLAWLLDHMGLRIKQGPHCWGSACINIQYTHNIHAYTYVKYA